MNRIVLKSIDTFDQLILLAFFVALSIIIHSLPFSVFILLLCIILWYRYKDDVTIFDENEVTIKQGMFKKKTIVLSYPSIHDVKITKSLFPSLAISKPTVSFKYQLQGKQYFKKNAILNFTDGDLMRLLRKKNISFYCNYD